MNYHYVKGSGWVPGDFEIASRVVHGKKITVSRKPPEINDCYYCLHPNGSEGLDVALDRLEEQIRWNMRDNTDYRVGGLYTQEEAENPLYFDYIKVTFWIENV